MKDKGFVYFHRKIHEWEWYTDSFTFHLFFHCVSSANFTAKKWRGVEVKRGQFITGRKKLSVETGLSEQQVRTCLKRLKSTNELTILTTPSYSIITVNNYDKYQFLLKNQPTEQPSINQPSTTTNNDNNSITISNINNSSSSLSKEDEEILKNLAKKNKIKYFRPWLRKITTNGDWVELLQKEKQRLQAKEEKKAKEQEQKANEVIPPEDNEEEQKRIEEIQKEIRARKRRRQ